MDVTCPDCHITHTYTFHRRCDACHQAMEERVKQNTRPIITPKDAALDFLRYYVYRGDSEEHLRSTHMGAWNERFHATIGDAGSWAPSGRRYPPTKVVIVELNGQPLETEAVLSLHELYQELEKEAQGFYQPALL